MEDEVCNYHLGASGLEEQGSRAACLAPFTGPCEFYATRSSTALPCG